MKDKTHTTYSGVLRHQFTPKSETFVLTYRFVRKDRALLRWAQNVGCEENRKKGNTWYK